jgi:hypothetical protein
MLLPFELDPIAKSDIDIRIAENTPVQKPGNYCFRDQALLLAQKFGSVLQPPGQREIDRYCTLRHHQSLGLEVCYHLACARKQLNWLFSILFVRCHSV